MIEAAGSIARALSRSARDGSLLLVRGEANSTGLAMLGGESLEWALDELDSGAVPMRVVVLENDLYQRRRAPGSMPLWRSAETVVVLDHQRTDTWQHAHLGLPAAAFAEADGTLVSLEGSCPAVLPGLRSTLYPPRDPHSRKLALAACAACRHDCATTSARSPLIR